jgi:type II secretory pathway component HofQ
MRTTLILCGLLLAGCCAETPKETSRQTEQARVAPALKAPAPVAPAPVAKVEKAPSRLVSIDADDEDLREVVDSIARQAGVNIVLDRGINEKVTLTLRNVPYFEALQLVAERTRCEINELRGGILFVIEPPRVTIQ